MHRVITSYLACQILAVLLSASAAGQSTYMLRNDSLMLSAGIEMVFKGGTICKTDKRGLVVEGTPAHDIDLWTTGPMIRFSSTGIVRFRANGRAYSGVLGSNTLIQCSDNVFREFARNNRIQFDDNGLLVRGMPVGSISFTVQDQEFMSQPGKPIGFHSNGQLHIVHPQGTMRLLTAKGGRMVISPDSWIELSENGRFLRGQLQRRFVEHHDNGEVIVHQAGETIRLDEDGNVQ